LGTLQSSYQSAVPHGVNRFGENEKGRIIVVTKKAPSQVKKVVLPKSLTADQVFLPCPPHSFKFKTTKTLRTTHDFIAQERAIKAINMGLGIRKPGYNIYVAGIQGTGKTSVIRSFLEKWSKDTQTPPDWIYVYNFTQSDRPKAIQMDTGSAWQFSKAMEIAVKTLKQEIPNALQSEDYENAVNTAISRSNEVQAKMFAELEKMAKEKNFQIKSTRVGIETIPIIEGRPLTEKEYAKLTSEDREKVEATRSALEPEVLDFARKVRSIEIETKQYVENLQTEIGRQVIAAILGPVNESYKKNKEIEKYLDEVANHILENLSEFFETDSDSSSSKGEDQELVILGGGERDKFRKYKINVFIDNRSTKGAPVVIETNPTYYNLFGKIEKNVEHGMYLTDYSMVHAGALHKANGGYLVLNAQDVFKTGTVWETLKRVLKNRKAYIEDLGEQFSLLPTSGLRPEPIPLDIKVILIGNDEIYHVLFGLDEDFQKIFKIKADFEHRMPRASKNIHAYASFIATRSKLEDLLPFHPTAISSIVEYGGRLVDSQKYLTTQYGKLKDLTIEADYVARSQNARTIRKEHVEEALELQWNRVNMVEDHMQEMIVNQDIILSFSGSTIGQVNGLAVYDLGDYSFGKPSRITCSVAMTEGGIFNIERASKLSGNIHDKGVYILTGFLNSLLSKKKMLGFSANVAFEQSYGMIDGDSATCAELLVIISALSGIPIRQDFAVTGSLNQFGEVQPVGGVNEKIEGFLKAYDSIASNEACHVIIPIQNQTNLMLHPHARRAVTEKRLKIYPCSFFWQVFELATGKKFGATSILDPSFAPGSALDLISLRLAEAEKLKVESNEKPKMQDRLESTTKKSPTKIPVSVKQTKKLIRT
jgi:lon-related putative ATP-dependent protease